MNFTLPVGGTAILGGIAGDDSSGNAESLTSLTATIDDTTDAYISHINSNSLYVKDRGIQPAGTTKTVNVTLNAKSADGTVLPSVVVPFDLQGPPLPPQATHLVFNAPVLDNPLLVADPGVDTVVLI